MSVEPKQEQKEEYTVFGQKIPPIFCQDNRPFWLEIRRLLIWLLRKLKEYYGLPEITI